MINPLVSIITVCYNSMNTIEATIKSVIEQTYSPIEYIIIDGGSNDGTIEIISKYKNYISVLISENDNGISDAFNKGIKIAKGEFVQLLNSDDVLDKNKIKYSVEKLIENPNYAFVYGDIIKSIKNKFETISGITNYHKKIKYVMPKVNHPTFLVKKNIYDKYGYFKKNYKVAMDYEWLIRIENKGENGIYSNKIVVNVSGGGISDEKAFLAFKECREISIKYGLNKTFANIYYLMRFAKQIIYKILNLR